MPSIVAEAGSEISIEKDTTTPDDGTLSSGPSSDHLPSFLASTALSSAPILDARNPSDGSNVWRQGLFHHLVVIHTIEDPKNYERKAKWFITFVVAAAAVIDTMGSNIFYPALPQIPTNLHTSAAIANLSVALYYLSLAIASIWWSLLSERVGRRTVYITSLVLYIISTIVAALSSSIGMLIAMRFLSGAAASSVTAVGAGVVADIWEVKERGTAIGIFYLGPLSGPTIGPVIGGVLVQKWSWRATQWFLMIYGAVVCTVILFCLPETFRNQTKLARQVEDVHPATSSKKRSSLPTKTKSCLVTVKEVLLGPLHIITYLRFPPILISVYFASITFGISGINSVSVQQTFSQPPYSFPPLIIGLLFLPNALGLLVFSLLGGRWSDRIMAREARKAGCVDEKGAIIVRPEDRMRENAWLSILLFPAALMWYGWSVQKGVLWIVPTLANFLIGASSMLTFGIVTTMLTEFVPAKAASLVALNSLGRNAFICLSVAVAEPLLRAIGNGWAFTVMGVLGLGSAGVVLAMRRWGERWRGALEEAKGRGSEEAKGRGSEEGSEEGLEGGWGRGRGG